MATRRNTVNLGFDSLGEGGDRLFSIHRLAQVASGAHTALPSHLFEYVSGTFSLELKQSGPQAVHSATFNTEVQNKWIRASIPIHLRFFFVFVATAPLWAMASPFTRFLDHTQRRTTVGRTPLDE